MWQRSVTLRGKIVVKVNTIPAIETTTCRIVLSKILTDFVTKKGWNWYNAVLNFLIKRHRFEVGLFYYEEKKREFGALFFFSVQKQPEVVVTYYL